ncbi:MAG: DUF1638 domain-containing protein [Acidimicrobiales bacterium]
MNKASPPRVLILACGALARELLDIARLNDLEGVTVECLPAALHNTPTEIPGAVAERLETVRGDYDRILLGYADCGTGGYLDTLCRNEGIEMLPGAHCYQFFAGIERFDAIHNNDPTAFYLTDYLAKHFKRLIMGGLGIDAHPELRNMYFGNYTKLIYLAQTDDAEIEAKAREAADLLGLRYSRIDTGFGDLEDAVVQFTRREAHIS